MGLTLYMHPVSQPARAVHWAVLATRTPCEVVRVEPGQRKEGGTRHPRFLAMHPSGSVPVVVCDGLALGESGAILTFLAEKFGWESLYPDDAEVRARVQQYLHAHHSLIRPITFAHFTPVLRPDVAIPQPVVDAFALRAKQGLAWLDATLATSAFVAGTARPTIADLQAYCEVSQLSARFFDVLDLTPFPSIRRWLVACEAIPGHAEAHRGVDKLVPVFRRLADKAKARRNTNNNNTTTNASL